MVERGKNIVRVFKRALFTYLVKRKAKKVRGRLYVNGYSAVTRVTEIGCNVHFNGLKVIGKGKLLIGDNFHSGTGCLIFTENHNYDQGKAIPYDDTFVIKEVIIQDNVWLGSNVILLPGTILSEGSIVQAGAVVSGNIPTGAIVGGNPGKVFKYRDLEHYFRLKGEQKFH